MNRTWFAPRAIWIGLVAMVMGWGPVQAPAYAQEGRQMQRRPSAQVKDTDTPGPNVEGEFENVLLPRALEGPIDPDTYILGPSDELMIVIRGPETRLHYLLVLPEGQVILPNLGALPATGMTLNEFRNTVEAALGRYYPNVDIDCQLSRPRTFVVFVLGEVERPGPVELTAPFRLSYALEMAGGIKANGSSRRIELRENGETVRTVDLFEFLKRGDFSENPKLREGYSVFVPPRATRVSVIGEVYLPDGYEYVPGETAADMLTFAGGLTTQAYPDQIILERIEGSEVLPAIAFSLEEASSIEVRDRDVIIVRDRLSFEGVEHVRIMGGGGRTGMVPLGEPEPLRDFLARMWRFHPEFEQREAVLESSVDGNPHYMMFDVRRVLAGDAVGDTLVKPGDTIAIPPVEGNIYVAGEVHAPGSVPYLPGSSVEYYVTRAGGPNTDGSFDRITILTPEGDSRGAHRYTVVNRGETVVVKRKASRIFGSVFFALTSLTSLTLSILALARD